MKGLVHICCAPDSIYFLEKLKNDYKDYEWIGFFYDPNIHPKTEYDLRLV
jgi:predicted adenine nucleotide alpha hydrolase (AANH) superfamily ATPase